jgi:hypothetical protein
MAVVGAIVDPEPTIVMVNVRITPRAAGRGRRSTSVGTSPSVEGDMGRRGRMASVSPSAARSHR